MKYIAEKKEDKYLITGIKEMETINGDKVEVKVDSKEYDKKVLEETLEAYTQERDMMFEKYTLGMNDMKDMLNAIEISNN
jgi:hypothetical protein